MSTTTNHKYLDIYNAIRSDILLKVYPDNSLLPTESFFMEKYGVSRNTIRRAIKMLQDNGFISTRQGSGSIVHPIHSDNLMENYAGEYPLWNATAGTVEYRRSYEEITVTRGAFEIVPTPPEVAAAFNIPVNTPIPRIQRIWKMDGVPYNYMIQYINSTMLPGFTSEHMDEDRKIRRLIDKHWSLHHLGGEEHISCINAGFTEANFLNVEIGAALMHTVRMAHCEKGIYEYAIFYGNPQYTGYMMHLN